MAHSAGASIVAQIAHEYSNITQLLLINPAIKLGSEQIKNGLTKFQGRITILVGSEDTSVDDLKHFEIITIEGADHYFSGKALDVFIDAPSRYLFN